MENRKPGGLGRTLESLTGDNTPAEKKPLVVRRGEYTGKIEDKRVWPRTLDAQAGGRVIIHAEKNPERPINSSRRARKGTCVIIRTAAPRPTEVKRYTTDILPSTRERYDIKPGKPIVIDPRKPKK